MVRSLTLSFLFALPLVGAGQGKLDAVRDAVDKPRSSDDSSSFASETNDDESEGAFGNLFLYAIGLPWLAPHDIFDPGLKVDGRFMHYPYADPESGHMVLNRTDQRPGLDFRQTQWYSARASAEIGSDFDGLTRVGLRLFLDTDTRFGLKTDWDYFSEKLDCGCRDELWLGDVTGTYRFVQNEQIQMHTGVGVRLLLDHGNDRGGVNFLYGFDAFPSQPVHVFGSAECGILGSARLFRLRGGVGVNWTHAELFAGYDYLDIGGAVLQGPFVGLRVWY